jgi:hypothetical protein
MAVDVLADSRSRHVGTRIGYLVHGVHDNPIYAQRATPRQPPSAMRKGGLEAG